jgi:hypothetical protein
MINNYDNHANPNRNDWISQFDGECFSSATIQSTQIFFWGEHPTSPQTACGRSLGDQEPPKEVPDEQIWQAFTEGVGRNPMGWPDLNGWTS